MENACPRPESSWPRPAEDAAAAPPPSCPLDLGIARVSPIRYTSPESLRIPRAGGRSDEDGETYVLVLVRRGDRPGARGVRDADWPAYDLMLCDRALPGYEAAAPGPGAVESLGVQFLKTLLPLPRPRVDRLLGTRLPGHVGVGALVVRTLIQLGTDGGHFSPADTARLGPLLVDLLTALLAHHIANGVAVAPPSRRRANFLEIQRFIQQHLDEPRLSPHDIAGAHHISVRYLHRLFADQDLTVAAWIRHQRLDRCRRDLTDPLLHARPVHAIAAKWGFVRPADFTRVFRAAYGMPPSEYRRLAFEAAS